MRRVPGPGLSPAWMAEPRGVSLESWRGLPLWIVWIWSTLPWGVALVTLVTAAAVEQLEPSWEDAARLAGRRHVPGLEAAELAAGAAERRPGPPRWYLSSRWPSPALRSFSGYDARSRFRSWRQPAGPNRSRQAAVWALMTGLFGLVGWMIWRWAGGTPILEEPESATSGLRSRAIAA